MASTTLDKNVLTVVRVRPVPTGTDVCWSMPSEAPKQIQLIDIKGKPTTAYGLGYFFKLNMRVYCFFH